MVLNLDFLNIILAREIDSRCLDLQTFRASSITQPDRTVIAKLG
jgi:hypothetical protein